MDLLAVTDIKKTLGTKEKIIFANDWIKAKINYKARLSKRKFDFAKFNSVSNQRHKSYMKGLRNRIIQDLAPQLNKIHNKHYTNRSWKIIIDLWLTEYLEANYYRWQMISNIFKSKRKYKIIFIKNLKNFRTPFDGWDFHCLVTGSDFYNQYIFQKIIDFFKYKKNKKIYISYSKIKLKKQAFLNTLVKRKNFYQLIKNFINFTFCLFTKRNKIYFDMDSIGLKSFFLNLKLRQIPYLNQSYFFDDQYIKLFKKKKNVNSRLRKKINLRIFKKNSFEQYLSGNINNDIPTSLMEDFTLLENCVEKILFKPKIIVSDTGFIYNTIFKFWVMKCVENKTKFFTLDHGGAFTSLFKVVNYDEEISDFAIRWHKPIFKNNVQLPALKILKFKDCRSNYKNLNNLTMIGFDTTKYPKHFLICPLSGQSLYQVKFIKRFYENLNLDLKNNFYFKPKIGDGIMENWNVENRVKDFLPENKIVLNYKESFSNARIIVTNSPRTSFYEAMISGPTILLYSKRYWPHTEHFNNLILNLKKAKILFEEPILAAQHLNEIWNKVDIWWESKQAKKARKQFFNEACNISENSINIWRNFLVSQEGK